MRTLIPLLFFSLAVAAGAALRLPAILGSHMVVQQGVPLPVWGWAAPGTKVTVSCGKERARAMADANGAWRVTLKARTAGGAPLTLTVAGGGETLTLTDILVGEVWLCSGQSNMEMATLSAANGRAEVAASADPNLRLFHVGNHGAEAPAADVRSGRWDPARPDTVDDFSAAGYLFARDLRKALGVPVGVIQAAWGGSMAEAWTPRAALAANPALKHYLDKLDADAAKYAPADTEKRLANLPKELDAYRLREARAWDAINAVDAGFKGQWFDRSYDEMWPTLPMPGPWENAGIKALENFDGIVWLRRTVAIPDRWVGHALTLGLAPVDDSDSTYVNGQLVGRTSGEWVTPRRYPVPAALVTSRELHIAVQALDMAFAGGFTGSIRDMAVTCPDFPDDAPVSLAGDWAWEIGATVKALADAKVPGPPGSPRLPTHPGANMGAPCALYNGMIAPLLPFPVRGFAWYQGESNSWKAAEYDTLLSTMIGAWRAAWGQPDAPFGIVQLTAFGKVVDIPAPKSNYAELREAQRRTAAHVPHTGLIVTIDVGEPANIHPLNKQAVGARLCRWALREAYGKPGITLEPRLVAITRTGAEVAVRFDQPLVTSDGKAPAGFALAGPDGKFVWVAAVLKGDTVVVSAPEVAALAYAFADSPVGLNLVNAAGLPPSPFKVEVK
jgi:sialate O-acetylesterase